MILIRLAMAAALAVTGISHAYLYVHGYQHIPTIGTAFVVQASVSFALAVQPGFHGPRPRWPAAHWARSYCRAPSAYSASPNKDGSPRHTRRSACSPNWWWLGCGRSP